MQQSGKRPHEGSLRVDAGTLDQEGFIAPSTGALEHALYFTAAPSVTEKAKQVLDAGRLLLPGVVVVWDETIGRRKGAKAVAKSWWADAGSLTAAFAFPPCAGVDPQALISQAAAAVVRAIESLQPAGRVCFQPPNDVVLGDKRLGAVSVEQHPQADIVVVRVNCNTDLDKAPPRIAGNACRLIDFIDVQQLPLQKSGTLQNTLLNRLMSEIPLALR